MNARIVVDPVTRIEGHLRIEATTDAAGNITQAYSAGTMVRGIETILKGRDPRDAWAFAQRICGVCTLVHGVASVRAVENALGYAIPPNAQLIRNLMIAAQFIHDHVMHFYHLHALDWVDVVSALEADPRKTSDLAQRISNYPKSSPGYFRDQQKRLKAVVQSGQLGIFGNGYWGHPEYRLPAELNLLALVHYLDALAWQREVVKLHTVFGGKNPHPNFVVGGAPSPISLNPGEDAGSTGVAVNTVGLEIVRTAIDQLREFVDQVYLPDVLAIAGHYRDWFHRGGGVRHYLTYGDFPQQGWGTPDKHLIPGGAILDGDLSRIHPVDLDDPQQIQEFIAKSWYRYESGPEVGLHPYRGETTFQYTGPKKQYDYLDVTQPYSWLKSPRWRGRPMEVGPLARMLVLYASGNEQARALVDQVLTKLELPTDALFSTMGRTAARALEAKLLADVMPAWYSNLLNNIKDGDTRVFNDTRWDPAHWPREARGVGYMEAPRGALAHWVVIEDAKIANYQAVVPSTWNAGPMDPSGQHGPYEASLMDNHRLLDLEQPLEILRTLHSFDPCIACAVHVIDSDGSERLQLRVR